MKVAVHIIFGAAAAAVIWFGFAYIKETCGQCPWHNVPGECCYPAQELRQ